MTRVNQRTGQQNLKILSHVNLFFLDQDEELKSDVEPC